MRLYGVRRLPQTGGHKIFYLDLSFPRSAWERKRATLCVASGCGRGRWRLPLQSSAYHKRQIQPEIIRSKSRVGVADRSVQDDLGCVFTLIPRRCIVPPHPLQRLARRCKDGDENAATSYLETTCIVATAQMSGCKDGSEPKRRESSRQNHRRSILPAWENVSGIFPMATPNFGKTLIGRQRLSVGR
jgi:hypothetical protein